jgi:hypothetical protein
MHSIPLPADEITIMSHRNGERAGEANVQPALRSVFGLKFRIWDSVFVVHPIVNGS